MIDICMAPDQSVSPHTGVRTIQNTGVFWQVVFQPPRPHSLFLEHGSAAKTLISHPHNTASYAGYVFRGLLCDCPTGFTSCRVHVDSSSLLSYDVSVICSPPWANLISCLFLQHFAKWFLLPHRVHCFPKAGHFLCPPWCGQRFPQLKHGFSLLLSTVVLLISFLTVTSVVVWFCTLVAC